MRKPILTGVNASVPLPMAADATPDLDSFQGYLSWLARQEITGITVNADTGEGAHLDDDERLSVVKTARETLGSEMTLVSGLIATENRRALRLAERLRDAGADALLVFSPPSFVGAPLPPQLVVDYFQDVARAGLPLVAFNLTPDLGGTILAPDTLRRLGGMGLIAALKEASFDPVRYIASRDAVRSAGQEVAFLSGSDNFIYESFVLGADGCLLGFAGLAGSLTVRLLELVKARQFDEAEALARTSVDPLAAVLFAPAMRDSRGRIKEGLRLLGLIKSARVRPPLLDLAPQDVRAVHQVMSEIGMLN